MNSELMAEAVIETAMPLFFPLCGAEWTLLPNAKAVAMGRKNRADFAHELLKLPSASSDPYTSWKNPQSERRSDAFCNLIAGFYWGLRGWQSSQDPDALDVSPAQLLLNVTAEDSQLKTAEQRWRSEGGRMFDGRMVALKNATIWTSISDLGFPFPPFSPDCGLALEDVDREEALDLGLMKSSHRIAPMNSLPFNRADLRTRLMNWIAVKSSQ